jgi:hypothetical protein
MRLVGLLVLALTALGQAAPESWIQPFPLGPIANSRPAMGAYFSADLDPNSIEFIIDGRSFRDAMQRQPGRWAMLPNYDVDRGRHLAVFSARTFSGESIRKDWTFTIQDPANLEFTHLFPAPQEISPPQPRIGSYLSAPVSQVRLELDGARLPTVGADGAVYHQMTHPLRPGPHSVRLQVVGLDGLVSEKSWTFQSQ